MSLILPEPRFTFWDGSNSCFSKRRCCSARNMGPFFKTGFVINEEAFLCLN
jgi:hypothetical protein